MNFIEIFYAYFATIFFCILFHLSGRKLFYSGIAGIIAWAVYAYFRSIGCTNPMSFFMSSLSITIYAEIMSKYLKTTATIMLIPALIPLVPGSGIYFTMASLVQGNYQESFTLGMETLFITVAITVGIVLITTLAQILNRVLFIIKHLTLNNEFFKLKKR